LPDGRRTTRRPRAMGQAASDGQAPEAETRWPPQAKAVRSDCNPSQPLRHAGLRQQQLPQDEWAHSSMPAPTLHEPPTRESSCLGRGHPGGHLEPQHVRAQELKDVLSQLEAELANPTSASSVGAAYRHLSMWTRDHMWDEDLPDVLDLLKPAHMYPDWRRQALEEAYVLFYEDVAKQGVREILEELPEPPTSEELGYRTLPEGLVSRGVSQGGVFSHGYEEGSAFCVKRKWEYDIKRTNASEIAEQRRGGGGGGGRQALGRQIVSKNRSESCCVAAVDPVTKFTDYFSASDFCCARNGRTLLSFMSSGDGAKSLPAPRPQVKFQAPTAAWPQPPSAPSVVPPSASALPMPKQLAQPPMPKQLARPASRQ